MTQENTIKGYVYEITNNLNKKWYIGSHDGHNPKYFGSGTVLKRAINKYGQENFTKEILFYSKTFQEDEGALLTKRDAAGDPQSYNLHNSGAGGNTGYLHTDEAKELMSQINAGEGNPYYGKKHTEEVRAQISASNMGKQHSKETRAKISEGMQGEKHYLWGKHLPEETRKKIGDAHRGEKNWNWGGTLSEETKAKISAATKGENNPNWGKFGKLHPRFEVPQEKVACPVCGKIGGISSMKRFHFDNCGKEQPVQKVDCSECGVEGGITNMKRYHFDNCKFKKRIIEVDERKKFFSVRELREMYSVNKHIIFRMIRLGYIEAEMGVIGRKKKVWKIPVDKFIEKFAL